MSGQAYDVDRHEVEEGFVLLTPLSPRARNWFTCHIDPGADVIVSALGVALVVDLDCVDDLVEGIVAAGMSVH